MYKLEISPINPNANGEFFNNWLSESHSPIMGVDYLLLSVEVSFSSEPSQEVKDDITTKYESLTVFNVIMTSELLTGIDMKDSRKVYGNSLHTVISEMSRQNRLSKNPVPPHEEYYDDHYSPWEEISSQIIKGNFVRVYELVNSMELSEFVTIETITFYRLIISDYLVSLNVSYIDRVGIKVDGGQYNDYAGKSIDSAGFILN